MMTAFPDSPFENWTKISQLCDLALAMNFSRETRLDLVMDILDFELYSSTNSIRLNSGARQYFIPRTEATFKRLFLNEVVQNVLGCEIIRDLKSRIRERGYQAVGFTYDGQWIVIVAY